MTSRKLIPIKWKANGKLYRVCCYDCLGEGCGGKKSVKLEQAVKCFENHGITNIKVYNLDGEKLNIKK